MPRHRGTALLLSLGLALAPLGCGSGEQAAEAPPSGYTIPLLRFAGVDLIYALRRIAAKAGMLLALDEIRSENLGPDLARFRVDLDLESGPVDRALEALKQHTQAFDFKIDDNVIYARSWLAVDTLTGLDAKILPAEKLEVNVEQLATWIMSRRPNSFLRAERVRGEPIYRRVEIDVPDKSSVLDVLLLYAKAANRGWRMRRAGRWIPTSDTEAMILASTLALWPSLEEPIFLPRYRMKRTTLSALAHLDARTATPICVVDRSPLGGPQGWLSYNSKRDPDAPLDQAIEMIARGNRGADDEFSWQQSEGILRVTSDFSHRLPADELLHGTLNRGAFEGTLPELARWLNENRNEPRKEILMGGEITGSGPRVTLQVRKGATLEETLIQFSKAGGGGWLLVTVDPPVARGSDSRAPEPPWQGAYLMPLEIWLP